MKSIITRLTLVLAVACMAFGAMAPRPAAADTQSTAAIIAGAAAIVGALLSDNSGNQYYVNDGYRHYVNRDVANYYRSHRRDFDRSDRYQNQNSWNQNGWNQGQRNDRRKRGDNGNRDWRNGG